MSGPIPYPLFKSWIKDFWVSLAHCSQDRIRTCTKGWFPYQLHKVITPCFTCHVTLCGHSMLPKVSYDHLTIKKVNLTIPFVYSICHYTLMYFMHSSASTQLWQLHQALLFCSQDRIRTCSTAYIAWHIKFVWLSLWVAITEPLRSWLCCLSFQAVNLIYYLMT